MRNHRRRAAQSATSIDQSPQDDETARMKQYVITMGIRTVCILLAFALQPWGWHTAILSVGAIFLPYIAVVLANQAGSHVQTGAVNPTLGLEGRGPASANETDPRVIRLGEEPPAANDEREGE